MRRQQEFLENCSKEEIVEKYRNRKQVILWVQKVKLREISRSCDEKKNGQIKWQEMFIAEKELGRERARGLIFFPCMQIDQLDGGASFKKMPLKDRESLDLI